MTEEEKPTPKEEKPPTKSMRIVLPPQNRIKLEQYARNFGCTHVKNRGVSQLLNKIAEGEIVLNRPSGFESAKSIRESGLSAKNPIVELIVNFPCDLNGSIAKLSEKIAKSKGNIYAINAHENIEHSHINFEAGTRSNKLYEELKQIKFSEVIAYNPDDKIKDFIRRTVGITDEEYQNSAIRHFKIGLCKNRPIIDSIRLMVCFRIETENKPSTLANISKNIAKRKITIRSVYQNINYDNDTGYIDLTIILDPIEGTSEDSNSIYDEVEKIQRSIKNIENVTVVKQIDVLPGQNPAHP